MFTKTPAVGLVIAVALVLGAGPGATPRLAAIQGAVEIGSGEPPLWRAARAGDPVLPGESVRVGAGGRAQLDIGTGSVRLYENSLLRLPRQRLDSAGPRSVDLDAGESLFDIDPAANRDGFQVRTPEAVVMVKGTRFAVALDDGVAAVSVFRGLVAVRELTQTLEHEVLVRRGFTAVLSPQLPLELRLDELPDPWDGWQRGERPQRAAALAREAAPAKIATDQARAAALRATRAEMFGRLARRNPELARRIKAAYAAKLAQQAALLDDGVDALHNDPVTQVPDGTAGGIEETMAGQILNPPSTSLPLDVKYVAKFDTLVFLDPSGQIVASLTETDIARFMATLDPTLIPNPVLFQIQASGLAPQQYLGLLDQMFFN